MYVFVNYLSRTNGVWCKTNIARMNKEKKNNNRSLSLSLTHKKHFRTLQRNFLQCDLFHYFQFFFFFALSFACPITCSHCTHFLCINYNFYKQKLWIKFQALRLANPFTRFGLKFILIESRKWLFFILFYFLFFFFMEIKKQKNTSVMNKEKRNK